MKEPCTVCEYGETEKVGIRNFIGCMDSEMEKGFKNDTFWYHHTCSNQKVKAQCVECKNFDGTYCNNVYSECKFEVK